MIIIALFCIRLIVFFHFRHIFAFYYDDYCFILWWNASMKNKEPVMVATMAVNFAVVFNLPSVTYFLSYIIHNKL